MDSQHVTISSPSFSRHIPSFSPDCSSFSHDFPEMLHHVHIIFPTFSHHLGVSINAGTSKSFILMGLSLISHVSIMFPWCFHHFPTFSRNVSIIYGHPSSQNIQILRTRSAPEHSARRVAAQLPTFPGDHGGHGRGSPPAVGQQNIEIAWKMAIEILISK